MPNIQMLITMDEVGNVNVQGPIQNKLMAYGMLKVAEDAIRDHHAASKDQRVQLAPAGLTIPTPPAGK